MPVSMQALTDTNDATLVVFPVSGTHKNRFRLVGNKTKDYYRFWTCSHFSDALTTTQFSSVRSPTQFAFAIEVRAGFSAVSESSGDSSELPLDCRIRI
uniref:Uncharacterized protein n=1 Tax=Rhipicephalus zambeziensis TaxID=60191 RepID=A0A224YKU5_9ACAR